jgi:hypothetical protein
VTTTISGTVWDPALANPLYGVTVYVPASPLQPLPVGVPTGADACSCSALFKSGVIASATTDAHGAFTLKNVPVGSGVPLVIQVGKWRHVTQVSSVTACMDNPQPVKSLALPATVAAGTFDSMPELAVSTGSADTLECTLRRMGISPAEFVPGPSAPGHVHLYLGGDPAVTTCTVSPCIGTRSRHPVAGALESDVALWSSQGSLMPYDAVLLSCEGGETYRPNPAALEMYLNAGGRVFASHYHYAWFSNVTLINQGVPPATDWGSTLATWTATAAAATGPDYGVIVQTSPLGAAFYQWLSSPPVSALGMNGVPAGDLSIYTPRYNATVGAANTVSHPMITDTYLGNPYTMQFTFDAPVAGPRYCGRAAYSDLHASGDPSILDESTGPPPTGCAAVPLSAQEKAIEFTLIDLLSCVN